MDQRSHKYPSEKQACRTLPEFLSVVQGLRPRWREMNLPTQSDRIRPYGEDRALWFRGQSEAGWGLTPKIWRTEYGDANEAEMRLALFVQEFEADRFVVSHTASLQAERF